MDLWEQYKKWFTIWEGATAQLLEQWLRSPLVLEPAGAWLSALMKGKAATDRATAGLWGAMGLPTKRDQERTLHALNQLQSRLTDLEDRLAQQAEQQAERGAERPAEQRAERPAERPAEPAGRAAPRARKRAPKSRKE